MTTKLRLLDEPKLTLVVLVASAETPGFLFVGQHDPYCGEQLSLCHPRGDVADVCDRLDLVARARNLNLEIRFSEELLEGNSNILKELFGNRAQVVRDQ